MDDLQLDVEACVAQVRAGDDAAARTLMQHLLPLVLKIVRSHRAKRESEEDLVQAVFIKVFSKLEQYSGAVPLTHWVSRVAVNTCLNQISREKVRPEVRYADLSETEEEVITALARDEAIESPDEAVASRELVGKLLDQLAPEDRLVIKLLHLEEKSVEEVRAATGWSAALVKVRAFRARAKLRKQLNYLLKERSHEKK
jgi:RNA polymerase sigma-70 factor, ECF subfamily